MKIFICFLYVFCSCIVQAQTTKPSALKTKAFTLVRFLEKNHYQPLKWNDSASQRLYDKWLLRLDEEKLFFTLSDIALLDKHKNNLDNELLGKEWNFFPVSIALFQQRVKKVDSIVQGLLIKPIDFLKPDSLLWPYTTYAANEQEVAQRWHRYFKWLLLNKIADNMAGEDKFPGTALPPGFAQEESKARKQVSQNEIKYIKSISATSLETMEESYLNAIAWCYDPHTTYMNMGKKKEFETEMSAAEYSAGFDLEENEKGDLVIDFLQPGGSAWRSGKLHSGDILLKIKMNRIEKHVEDIDPEELEQILSGNRQDEVEITVKTAAGEQKTVRLVKEKITDDESIVKSYVLQGSKNIGYINLPGFYSREQGNPKEMKDITYDGCANDVSKEIVKLKKDSIQGLILDLRYNGGGSMWEAMQLAGIFIDIGPVASVKEKDGKVMMLKDPNRGTIYDGPLLVLVNGASASASEFLSAALQDYNRAIIVGGNTYGKGTAQSVMPLDTNATGYKNDYEDFVKVTGQKFYRINGSTTQWKGVVPDIILPDVFSGDMHKEKTNKSALLPDENKKGIYQALEPLPLQKLIAKNEKRVAADPYFKKIQSLISFSNQSVSTRLIPLQWKTYAAHYKKAQEMFQLANGDEVSTTSIKVRNNAFDRERIILSPARSQEINVVYLQNVESDKTVEEGYNILMDWLMK